VEGNILRKALFLVVALISILFLANCSIIHSKPAGSGYPVPARSIVSLLESRFRKEIIDKADPLGNKRDFIQKTDVGFFLQILRNTILVQPTGFPTIKN